MFVVKRCFNDHDEVWCNTEAEFESEAAATEFAETEQRRDCSGVWFEVHGE